MGFPETQTVGSLLAFLQEQLAKGNVDSETKVFTEVYVLSAEEEFLKPREEELGYHVPDEIADECLAFRTGVWQGFPEGKCRNDKGDANYVAFSCYLAPRTHNPFFAKVAKIHQVREMLVGRRNSDMPRKKDESLRLIYYCGCCGLEDEPSAFRDPKSSCICCPKCRWIGVGYKKRFWNIKKT